MKHVYRRIQRLSYIEICWNAYTDMGGNSFRTNMIFEECQSTRVSFIDLELE